MDAFYIVRAVVNEALRLFPPVPINQRMCGAEPAVFPPSKPGGPSYYVPAETDIIYIPLLLHRRKDLWGDDAEEFNPQRWLDEDRVKKFVQNPMIFVPFNAGPRIVRPLLTRLSRVRITDVSHSHTVPRPTVCV